MPHFAQPYSGNRRPAKAKAHKVDAPDFSAPPGFAAWAMPPPELMLASMSAATAEAQRAYYFNGSGQYSMWDDAPNPFWPAPGHWHAEAEEPFIAKCSASEVTALNSSGETASVFSRNTTPPSYYGVTVPSSQGDTFDPSDSIGSDSDGNTLDGTKRTVRQLSGTSYIPGRIFSQESIAPQAALNANHHVPAPGLSAAPKDKTLLGEEKGVTLVAGRAPGEMSAGSLNHPGASCRPCQFVYRNGGCWSGANCQYCHLCEPSEKTKKVRSKPLPWQVEPKSMNSLA